MYEFSDDMSSVTRQTKIKVDLVMTCLICTELSFLTQDVNPETSTVRVSTVGQKYKLSKCLSISTVETYIKVRHITTMFILLGTRILGVSHYPVYSYPGHPLRGFVPSNKVMTPSVPSEGSSLLSI